MDEFGRRNMRDEYWSGCGYEGLLKIEKKSWRNGRGSKRGRKTRWMMGWGGKQRPMGAGR